ncbi:MAG TPA: hypothetical protein VK421_09550, partial [Pyrinomonadaceae bacterium]|nr:hypothetical protein [Pyrinomonadaceae bacterium]
RIFAAKTGADEESARAALEAAGGDLRVALVMHATNGQRADAEHALAESRGVVRQAIESLSRG